MLDGGLLPIGRPLPNTGWCYIAGNRGGLTALQRALGALLRSRHLEIFEGVGFSVIFDRHR